MKPGQAIARFFFPDQTGHWVAVLRIGLGTSVLYYCLSLRSDWTVLLKESGDVLLNRRLSEAFAYHESVFIPTLGRLVEVGSYARIPEEVVLWSAWIVLLAAALCLLAGIWPRAAAIIAWLLHLMVTKSSGLFAYGADSFLTIGLFYLMLSPLPDLLCLTFRAQPRADDHRTRRFIRRVLQLHLCVIYFFSGLTKALGTGWWDGTNMWRALTREPFDVLSAEFVARIAGVLPALGICVVMIEICYPLFIWPARTRLLWLCSTCGMHLMIGLVMGMHLFAVVMMTLNFSAFAPLPFRLDEVKSALPLSVRRAFKYVAQRRARPRAGDRPRSADRRCRLFEAARERADRASREIESRGA